MLLELFDHRHNVNLGLRLPLLEMLLLLQSGIIPHVRMRKTSLLIWNLSETL